MYEILSRKKCSVLWHFNQFDHPEHNLSLLYDPDSIDFDSESFTLNDAGQQIRLCVSRTENYHRDPYSIGFDRSQFGTERLPKEYHIRNESVRNETGAQGFQRLAVRFRCKPLKPVRKGFSGLHRKRTANTMNSLKNWMPQMKKSTEESGICCWAAEIPANGFQPKS